MIDPTNITNFQLDQYQLEEMLLFWVLVAGKNAKTTAGLLDTLLTSLHRILRYDQFRPFEVVREFDKSSDLASLMRQIGFGCTKMKSRALRELSNSFLDLKTCSTDALETIYGIGPKTARCFVMHTRENVRCAGIDTHLLKWLAAQGVKVPKSTPKGKKYKELEKIFLDFVDKLQTTPAKLDLEIWVSYSQVRKQEVSGFY